jgi:branched-chain amino acid transport system substrate-binding protein
MRIRKVAALLTPILAVSVVSCASEPESSTEGAQGSGSGQTCELADPVKVGAALSLTGAAAAYGDSQKKGLELALGQLNEKGGVKYDLAFEDDATDPKQGITVFEKFIGDGTSVILGPTLSNAAKITDPIAQENAMPVLGISNTAAGITEIGDYIFRDSLTESVVIPNTIKEAKDKLDLKQVVLMYSNDDAFTQSGYDAFAAALKDQGVEVTKTITFSKADTDFRALLTDAKESTPDALVVSALIEAAIPLVTQARELGIDAPIIGGNGFNTPKLISEAGAAANGVIVGAAWNPASNSEANAGFLDAYKAKYDAAPDQFAAQAYTGLLLVDQAVRAECSTDREKLRDNLAELKDVPTPLGNFSFDANRDAVHPPVVQVVENGNFALLN